MGDDEESKPVRKEVQHVDVEKSEQPSPTASATHSESQRRLPE